MMGPPPHPFLLNLLLGLTLTMHAGMEIRRLDKGVESLASLRHSHLCPMETKTAAKLVLCYIAYDVSMVCMAAVVSVDVVFYNGGRYCPCCRKLFSLISQRL